MSITKNERTPLVGATQTSTFGAVVTSFNSSGNFVAPPATTSVTYLVLAGGGAGGLVGVEELVATDHLHQAKHLAVELRQNQLYHYRRLNNTCYSWSRRSSCWCT